MLCARTNKLSGPGINVKIIAAPKNANNVETANTIPSFYLFLENYAI